LFTKLDNDVNFLSVSLNPVILCNDKMFIEKNIDA